MKRYWLLVLLITLAMILPGCAQPTPQIVVQTQVVPVVQTQVVEKQVIQTQVVEKQVVQTQIVEKSVTATPPPPTAVPAVPKDKQFGGTLNAWLPDRWPEQSWLNLSNWQSAYAISPMAEVPFRLRADGKLEPVLATSYDVTPDGLTYTLHLRQGVKWHDGVPFTSADVVYTYQTYADPNLKPLGLLRYGTTIKGFLDYQAGKVQTIDGIKAVDDLTVQFILSAPDASLPNLFWTYTFIPMVPKHAVEKLDKTLMLSGKADYWYTNPVGTGPYKFVKYVTDQYIEYARNDDYWGGKVGPEKLFMKISSADVATVGLQKGEIDLMPNVPLASVAQIKTLKNVQVVQNNQAGTFYGLEFNFKALDGFWQNPVARQAFAYAVDRAGYVQSILGGNGFVSNSWFDGTVYACPTMTKYDYNPTKAKQLFDSIGMTEAKRKTTTLTLMSWLGLKQRQDFLPIAQQNLRDLGFIVNVDLIDNALINDYNGGKGPRGTEWTAHVLATGPGGDPGNVAPFLKSDASSNFGARGWPTWWPNAKVDPTGFIYKNAKVDDLLTQGAKETDPEKRKAIYQQVDCIFNQDQPALTVAAPADVLAMSARLQGVDWKDWDAVGLIGSPNFFRPVDWWLVQGQ